MKQKTNRIIKQVLLLFVAVFMLGSFSVQASAASKKKTLIVYYSRTGTTKEAAKKIQKLTGADIVQLKTKKSYPSDYDKMLEVAQEEQDENARPELTTKISDFKDYNTIIVGYPIWWGMQPMAINTFLESYDFTGKKVIPFCTSGGSGISDSVSSMKKICKNATFGTGLNATDASNSKLKKWLKNNKVSLESTSPKVTLKIKKKNVTKRTYSLKEGSKATLKVSVSNLKGKKKIKYSSSNKKVATVSAKGVVKAKKTGTAKIKVTVSSQKKKITAWTKIKVVKKTSSKPKQPSNDNSDSNTSDSNNSVNDTPDSNIPDNNIPDNNTPDSDTSDSNVPDNNSNTPDNNESNGDTRQRNILVAYFSCTGTTKPLAEYAAEYLNADLYEIEPETPYTSDDLNYGDSNSRATKEQNDSGARPAISGNVEKMSQYDTVVLAFPIWWGQAPRIISTFLESYDFSGKTIVPFCTSHSSGIGSSDTNLHALVDSSVTWKAGKRFAAGTSKEEIIQWLKETGIEPFIKESGGIETMERAFNFETKTVTLNSGYEMPLNGIGTYSLLDKECVNSVSEALKRGVRLIDTAYMYDNDVICCEL